MIFVLGLIIGFWLGVIVQSKATSQEPKECVDYTDYEWTYDCEETENGITANYYLKPKDQTK